MKQILTNWPVLKRFIPYKTPARPIYYYVYFGKVCNRKYFKMNIDTNILNRQYKSPVFARSCYGLHNSSHIPFTVYKEFFCGDFKDFYSLLSLYEVIIEGSHIRTIGLLPANEGSALLLPSHRYKPW